jgi:hypothetical protein
MDPAAILRNTKTGLFHPVYFRRAPTPMARDENDIIRRYSSKGHDIPGFATLEEAKAKIARLTHYWDSGEVIDWNPDEQRNPNYPPNITRMFDTSKFDASKF